MALSGRQKAAMLLMSLDAATAAELLRGMDSSTVQELAVEVAYLDASGGHNASRSTDIVRQFCQSLETGKKFDIQNFLGAMLKSAVGQEKADRIQTQIQDLLQQRDPFIPIRQAETKGLAAMLAKEHPQAASVVLSELPPRKSSEVLALLEDKLRHSVVTRMAAGETIGPDAKLRIAQMVLRKLEAATGPAETPEDQTPRKVALMLRNLSREIRDGLLSSITRKNEQAAEAILSQMLIWEDLLDITDRSLQQALREIDVKKLAMALMDADETVAKKIKSNVSERAAESIQEEASLLSSPTKADIQQARDEIVEILRGLNESGNLQFIEE